MCRSRSSWNKSLLRLAALIARNYRPVFTLDPPQCKRFLDAYRLHNVFYCGEKTCERIAKDICRYCPDKVTCLAIALEAREHGIWGGTTEGERRHVSNKHRRMNLVR
ncbi:MAG: WhiB family transcriptional regulator [Propionibacteriaceae bacterium]|nr:WhiB family transcriptional regulator [Propionibacteriaceae bacterium]